MNIPQGYKQTELGIIPEDWEVKSFSQIFDMYPNNTYPRDCMNDSRGVVRNIHYGDVLIKYPTIVDVENCAIPYLNEGVKIKLQKLVQSGDIIIADTAEDETVGKCVEIKNVGDNKIVAGLHTFFCRPTAPFAAGWLGYYINSTNYHNQLIPYITGIKVSSISRTSIQETKLLVPPIAEQRVIAEALSDVDGLIAALDKKIAKKRLLKQGAMQQLLTGKKRLPGFTDEWKYVALEHLLEYEQPTKYLVQSTDYIESGTPVLTAGKTFILGYTAETKGIYTNLPVIIFDDFTTDSKYVTMPFKAKSSAMKMLQLKDRRYNLRLVYELMQLIQFPLYDHQRYWISEYSKLQVYIPSDFKEQQAIATILSDMDKEIADLEAQRDKYRLLKSGMMQKLLTGQIRLKNNL